MGLGLNLSLNHDQGHSVRAISLSNHTNTSSQPITIFYVGQAADNAASAAAASAADNAASAADPGAQAAGISTSSTHVGLYTSYTSTSTSTSTSTRGQGGHRSGSQARRQEPKPKPATAGHVQPKIET